jgi:hypothetical protein
VYWPYVQCAYVWYCIEFFWTWAVKDYPGRPLKWLM